MSQPPIVPYTLSFTTLFRDYAITLGRLGGDKEARALVKLWAQFRPRLLEGHLQEIFLEEAISVTQEGVHGADTLLNEVSLLVLETALAQTRGSYTAPLYDHLAAGERPSVFIRPILGKQLVKVRTWIEILKDPTLPEDLRALQPSVVEAVNAADEAIANRDKAQEERSRFWKIGQKKQLIDDFNQHRRDLSDKLKALVKESPDEYARGFFADRKVSTRIEGEALVNALQEELSEAEATTAALRERLVTAQQGLEKQRQEEEDREAARLALAQEERAIAEAKKRAQELRAKLAKR